MDLINMFLDFITNESVLLYLMIFSLKTIEVSVAVIRIILLTRGNKLMASFISFFEVLLWLFLVSTVLVGISDDPIKAVVYAGAFAFGQFIGSYIESKMAIGDARVEAIVIRDHTKPVATALRERGYAITTVDGEGMNCARTLLIFYVPRRKVNKLILFLK